ncbi:hypothetical protein [Streptomyces wedmorensis]|uniref:hypothetical protein n=1 Tax=Streptomyces wedmorensis TaxID=43759 RepID=UPI0037A6929D
MEQGTAVENRITDDAEWSADSRRPIPLDVSVGARNGQDSASRSAALTMAADTDE